MNQKIKEFLFKVSKDIFIISFFTFIIYFILENFKRGFVINYINMNILLTICLLSGIIVIFLYEGEEKEEKKKGNWKIYLLMGINSFLGVFIVWWYLRNQGWFGWLGLVLIGITLFLIQWQISDKINNG